ncbi:putative transcriptional regulator [Propionispira arboris]|uniref:Putative transcriptional regulator n=1 Tax=Propionispira arboris TaxID=84035 RepID=A0A1H7A2D9_9FIRM|nr:helix-turn-helix transcriptional regulator [Propionispira arboris]SEJ59849.1 putative transcriptional regulator [Propionispira arboris]
MNILKKTRLNNNLKPIDMAKELKISKSYYSMLENGGRDISKNIAINLKKRFGVELDASFYTDVHKS